MDLRCVAVDMKAPEEPCGQIIHSQKVAPPANRACETRPGFSNIDLTIKQYYASSLPTAPLGSQPRSRRCPPRAHLPRLALQGRPEETRSSGLRQASPRAQRRLRAGFLEPRQTPDVPRSRPSRIGALVRLHTHKLTSRLVRTHRPAPGSSGRRLPR